MVSSSSPQVRPQLGSTARRCDDHRMPQVRRAVLAFLDVYCTSARGTGYCATDTRPRDLRSAQARVRGSVQVNRHYHRWYAMRDGCLLRLGKPYQSRIGARLAVVPKHLRARAVRGFIRTCDDACGQPLTTEQ